MKIEEKVSLKNLNTFKTGGEARFFCLAENVEDLASAVLFAKENNLKVFVLGGGSNLLIPENGFDGLVIQMAIKGIRVEGVSENKVEVSVGAGESWDKLVDFAVSDNLYGIENLSGIPGTVGASPVQNIGAYGSEAKDVIFKVKAFNTETLEIKTFSNEECCFGYRDSFFKSDEGKKYIVTEVSFLLTKNGELNTKYKDIIDYFFNRGIASPTLLDLRSAVLEIRKNKLPDLKLLGTAGSFFKNVIISKDKFEDLKKRYPLLPGYDCEDGSIKISTAWILDNVCGLKGFKIGKVGLYEKQPLVLVNYGDALSGDIVSLMKYVIGEVKNKTDLVLESEVVII